MARTLGPEPKKPEQPNPKLKLFTYGCNTYGGKLVTIQIPATDERFAGRMAHQMMMATRELIDVDEGLWLNDEEDY